MTPLVQICIVLVTLSFVALVGVTLMAMVRLGQTATRLTATAETSMAQFERIVKETQELLVSLREVVTPAQRAMLGLERVSGRVTGLSHVLLDEVEEPVLAVAAVARGVRAGAVRLATLWSRRMQSQPSSNHGVHDDE
jgi:uncharacterized protein YoxC